MLRNDATSYQLIHASYQIEQNRKGKNENLAKERILSEITLPVLPSLTALRPLTPDDPADPT